MTMINQVVQSSQRSSVRARVLVISDAAPHRNGVGAYYADLVDELEPCVEKVEIVSPEIVGEKWQGGWMLPLPGDRTQKFCLPNGFDLQKKIREFQPTVVVIPTPGLVGLLGAILAKRLGIPVIVGFHTWFEKLAGLYWNRLQGGLTRTYFELVNKALFKVADKVLANSIEMVQIARENGAPEVSLIGTPVSQALLDVPVVSIPKSIKKILFVGRLAAEKNLQAIVDAAICCPELEFSFAGDGPEREWLEGKSRGLTNIELLGWVSRNELTSLIDQHDALVLPSKVESFGTVAMEAMVRQRLVVVSSACGITQWSDLSKGLTIIDASSSLAEVLIRAISLSEFELFSRCFLARKVVLGHISWNKALWLNCLTCTDDTEVSSSLATSFHDKG